jgi:signal transduction histidine kinase
LYSTIADYNKALEANKIALEIYRKIGNYDEMNSCYMNIGNIYKDLKQPKKALEYMKKANAAFVKFDNGISYGVFEANINMADTYLKATKTQLAEMGISHNQQMSLVDKHLKDALHVAKGMQDRGLIGEINNKLGNLYEVQNKNDKALAYYKEALKSATENQNDHNLSIVYLSLGSHFLKTQDYNQSKVYLNQSLEASQRANLLLERKDALEKMSILAQEQGDYKAALDMHKQYVAVKEQIIDQEKEKEITRKQLKIDFEIKENDYKIRQQYDQKIKWILGIAAAVLLGLSFWVFYNQRKTQKLNTVISKQKVELEQLGMVKDKMFSLVSHDMRTPVNALISFITLLENRQISQEKLGLYAGELKNQLTQTTNLMENMLNWAASQMQGYKPNMHNENIHQIVESVLQNTKNQADLKGILIKNDIPISTNALVDSEMLGLIIRNLLANAIKFSKKNGQITMLSNEDSGSVKVSVIDNGRGMNLEKLEQINNQENTLIDSTVGTDKEKGTGMGLMLCKTFAKLINGKLTAQSTENEGSEFVLELKKA